MRRPALPKTALALFVTVVWVAASACSGESPPGASRDGGAARDGGLRDAGGSACPVTDTDDDTIPDEVERAIGNGDADGDGNPNHIDTDSDDDGLTDRFEAGDEDCLTGLPDADGDGLFDFVDPDANNDGIRDGEQASGDLDGDGVPDRIDLDVDGDGLPNESELGPGGISIDTDGDGAPDTADLDSDDDTIADRDEGLDDPEADGIPNFRDPDSDDDGTPDAVEAGDADLGTAPVHCNEELADDTIADYLDIDSDGDGLADGEEVAGGTGPCDPDSDDDTVGDLLESAYERVVCVDGTENDCDCAIRGACTPPATHLQALLPNGSATASFTVDVDTTIGGVDVFFLVDSTGSMGGPVARFRNTLLLATTGVVARLDATLPSPAYGIGTNREFPFTPYSASTTDFVFEMRHALVGSGTNHALQMAASTLSASDGGDRPASHTEALFQLITGEGATWTSAGQPSHVTAARGPECGPRTHGAPCFRDDALGIVVHISDSCSHNEPPGGDVACDAYADIMPAPHSWAEAADALRARGARYVGVNTGGSCAAMPTGTSACHFMQATALQTRSLDDAQDPIVVDVQSGGVSNAAFADAVVAAVQAAARPAAVDVTVMLKSRDANPVDASAFLAVSPASFPGVIPGAVVSFTLAASNDTYDGETTSQVLIVDAIALLDDGVELVSTPIHIVTPARGPGAR